MTDQQILEDPPELAYPFFAAVPRLPNANLEYREELLKRCEDDRSFRLATLEMCKQDALYWVSAFAYLFEPRPTPHVLPFILWSHQVPAWKDMERYLGICDVGLEKSRGEGASWMILMLCLHRWLFMPMFAAGFVSKDEASVDTPDNPDTLFWKLDFQLKNLPKWMVPTFTRNRSSHMLTNSDNGATLSGFSATGDVATGGRKTVMVMDEFGKFPRGPDQHAMNSTQYVTDCRYLISTPKGPEGAYFEAMTGNNLMKKVILDWKMNPVRSVGGYKVLIAKDDRRTVELVDLPYWKRRAVESGADCHTDGDVLRMASKIQDKEANPFKYPFMLTGPYIKHDQLRSPWYDTQCQRPGATPSGIAQELDRDYGGSTSRFFDINMLTRLQKGTTEPHSQGEMPIPRNVDSHLELNKIKFQQQHGGRLHLWFKPDLYGRVPMARNYVIGGDISAGGGGVATSNSALCVLDRTTGRQVAEIASPQIPPVDLADYAVALCYWFTGPAGPAILIWEANGPNGAQFGQRIMQLGYSNIYFRGQTEEFNERETRKMGFWTSSKTKPPLLGELGRAMDSGKVEVSSYLCLDEAKFYVNLLGGKIEHISQSTEKDPSGAGERHGDRVVALALAWWVVKDYLQEGSAAEALRATLPTNSAFGRRQLANKAEAESHAWVPPSQLRFKSHVRRK